MISLEGQPQIIATLGPASREKQTVRELILAGMRVARLNFSWGTHDEHRELIKLVREVSKEEGVEIAVMQDLSGPRVQTDAGHQFDEHSLQTITSKDKDDIKFGSEMKVDYVALSYVGDADDLRELRGLLPSQLAPAIVAKIERQKAIDGIKEIVDESDVIMVARGDLGDAVPFETLPFVKEELIKAAHEGNKPAIVATEFMTSMIKEDRPTRAEVSDIADTVLDGANALMLSNETAVGEHPVEAVSDMHKVIAEAYSRK